MKSIAKSGAFGVRRALAALKYGQVSARGRYGRASHGKHAGSASESGEGAPSGLVAAVQRAGPLAGGVYFEAGFAMGLGIPVIWTVRKDQLEQVHFDIRQYNFIVYETPEDLKEKLRNRIGAMRW